LLTCIVLFLSYERSIIYYILEIKYSNIVREFIYQNERAYLLPNWYCVNALKEGVTISIIGREMKNIIHDDKMTHKMSASQ